MEVKRISNITFSSALHEAVLKILEKHYQSLDYRTIKGCLIQGLKVDLYCHSDTEEIFIIIRPRRSKRNKNLDAVHHLEKIIEKRPNARLVVEYFDCPQDKEITIKGFNNLLFKSINADINTTLAVLSDYTSLTEIYNIDLATINIDVDRIHIYGIADVNVRLQYGLNNNTGENNIEYRNISLWFKCDLLKHRIINKLEYNVIK